MVKHLQESDIAMHLPVTYVPKNLQHNLICLLRHLSTIPLLFHFPKNSNPGFPPGIQLCFYLCSNNCGAFCDIMNHWFFAVYMFAFIHSGYRNIFMPKIGGCNDYGIDIFSFQYFFIITGSILYHSPNAFLLLQDVRRTGHKPLPALFREL